MSEQSATSTKGCPLTKKWKHPWCLHGWPQCIALGIGALAAVYWWFDQHTRKTVAAANTPTTRGSSTRTFDVVRSAIAGTGVITIGPGASVALFKNTVNEDNLKVAQDSMRLSQASVEATLKKLSFEEDATFTDRYTKAVEQLGSPSIHVRLGGIYALERLAGDSERDRSTVIEVLAAFTRAATFTNRAEDEAHNAEHPNEQRATSHGTDIYAALTALSRINTTTPSVIDLRGVYLPGADLAGLNLARVDLTKATLTRADLTDVNLCEANLARANLTDTNLTDANLTTATLTSADLTGATLRDATLTRANLNFAHLRHADLTCATLSEVKLTRANLTDVNLTDTNLTGANLTAAVLSRADLTDADLTDAHLTRANLTGADLARADLDCADLREADLREANLTGADMTGAALTNITWEQTIWPVGFTPPPSFNPEDNPH